MPVDETHEHLVGVAADLQKFVGPPLWNDSIEHFFQLRHQPPLSSQHIDGGNDRSDAGDDAAAHRHPEIQQLRQGAGHCFRQLAGQVFDKFQAFLDPGPFQLELLRHLLDQTFQSVQVVLHVRGQIHDALDHLRQNHLQQNHHQGQGQQIDGQDG